MTLIILFAAVGVAGLAYRLCRAIDGLETGASEVLADERSVTVRAALSDEPPIDLRAG